MQDIKIGQRLELHSYKHNGEIQRGSDETIVIDIKDDYIVVGNYRALIIKGDGRIYRTREPAIMYFYKDRWFNIIGQLKKYGLFYYCNLATPYLIDDGIIKYIDYDLDLRVFPDGGFRVLDNNEYNYHKKKMDYPEDIEKIIKDELSELIEMKRKNIGPFAPGTIEKYYEMYKNIKKR